MNPSENTYHPSHLLVRPIEPSWKVVKEGYESKPKYVEAEHKDAALKIAYPDYTWVFCLLKHTSLVPCWIYSGFDGWAEVYELEA